MSQKVICAMLCRGGLVPVRTPNGNNIIFYNV